MAFRQRTLTLRPNLSIRRVYETFQPCSEIKDLPEAYLLRLYLPGYAEDDIGAEFEYDYRRRVRVFGRRSLGDNRSIRFNIAYAVPMNCDVNKLKGVFQGEIFSIIMPKVTIPREVQDDIMKTCEALTLPKSDSVPQKGEEGVSQDAKNQREVSFESSEKRRVERKETKDESENGSASGKPPQKGKNEGVMDETSSIRRSKLGDIECKIGERKGKEKVEMNSKIGDVGSAERIRIKEVAATASQAVRSLIKGFNEEDKHLLLYTSVTVLVLALGVYTSYKLRSLAK
ncbi:inactive protein RESTRICTED TEV MOVEMENT 2-like [Vigna radiata var. radiata]|uniref:Inactive protein RESTRICTED TEV MOVEMENT 2-like n=1 Tax=Vigna radiata var. radiata TaxID=3916 RepID=A0A1S3T7V9_VIGRR|nr:inactive protein RESTRICTED TEV MOVEMENT 2-like [Vigna radiata var. radiata]